MGDTGRRRHHLQVARECLARDVPGLRVGRKQPRPVGGTGQALLQDLQVERHSRPRGLRDDDKPLAAALALDGDQRIASAQRMARQRHQLRDAQARGIEQLEQRVHPRGAQPLAGRAALDVEALLGDGEQAVDVLHRQDLGQPLALARPFQDLRGIVGALALGDEEAMELADRRELARRRRGLEAQGLERREIGAQVVCRGIERRTPACDETCRISRDVAAIGVQRVGRRATLGGDHVEEQLDEAVRGKIHRGVVLEAAADRRARAACAEPARPLRDHKRGRVKLKGCGVRVR